MSSLDELSIHLTEVFQSEIEELLYAANDPFMLIDLKDQPNLIKEIKQLSTDLAISCIIDYYYDSILIDFINSLRTPSYYFSNDDNKKENSQERNKPIRRLKWAINTYEKDTKVTDFLTPLINSFTSYYPNISAPHIVDIIYSNFSNKLKLDCDARDYYPYTNLLTQRKELLYSLIPSFFLLYFFRLDDKMQQTLLNKMLILPLENPADKHKELKVKETRFSSANGQLYDWLRKEYITLASQRPENTDYSDYFLFAIEILKQTFMVANKSIVLTNLYLLNMTTDFMKIVFADTFITLFKDKKPFLEYSPISDNCFCLFLTTVHYSQKANIINANTVSDLDLLLYKLKRTATTLIEKQNHICSLNELVAFAEKFTINPVDYMLDISIEDFHKQDFQNNHYSSFSTIANIYFKRHQKRKFYREICASNLSIRKLKYSSVKTITDDLSNSEPRTINSLQDLADYYSTLDDKWFNEMERNSKLNFKFNKPGESLFIFYSSPNFENVSFKSHLILRKDWKTLSKKLITAQKSNKTIATRTYHFK